MLFRDAKRAYTRTRARACIHVYTGDRRRTRTFSVTHAVAASARTRLAWVLRVMISAVRSVNTRARATAVRILEHSAARRTGAAGDGRCGRGENRL